MRQLIKLFASLLLLSSFTANAIPLTYDEAVDGDIVNQSTLFALDFGVNTVSGTINSPNTIAIAADFDKFDALLPTNGILESIELTLLIADGGTIDRFAKVFEVRLPDGSDLLKVDTPVGGSFYWAIGESFDRLNFIGLNSFPGNTVNDYTIKFNIASVPEPSIAFLMASGLIAFGVVRRKSRA